ncbi:outer membrane protein assembly factor BamB family protein [Thermococcus nautili]|uniref:WD40-like repeat protein n=1 Tax=Thermococcus nautili TaxID=195522 RepID=W8NVI8_9EURY|nr:CGP-CTERM sorting domain-containing protein [Thermococcus nautili]AHL23192.1 WD40-like repeat protein [Thermococcus nautili]CAI1493165.1 WD40-like repeat protein [Thermococcus nautili]
MKRSVPVILVALLAFLLLGSVSASQSPVLWKGTVCDNVKYQKSIEAVALTEDAVYAACSYRQVMNSSGLVEVYYLGVLSAFSTNGSRLWQNSSGYTVKLVPTGDDVLAGSFGALLKFDKKGRIVSLYDVVNKLYDFVVSDGVAYVADGDFFLYNGSRSYKGHVYAVKLGENLTGIWNLTFDDMITRVRAGDGIIYASSGFPSGYVGSFQFGSLYGISPEGKLLWNVSLGHWVRDMEVWKGNAVLGTGWDNSKGRLYVVSPAGKVLLNESLFYTEDILVLNDTAYIGGYDGKNGTLVAVELPSGKTLWERKFPYRVKTLAYTDGVLLAGTGKFQSKTENGTTYIYSVGNLYAINPKDGKTLGELPNTGYVRSIAVKGSEAVIGTASSTFYVIDVSAMKGSQKSSICGPGFIVLLAALVLLLRRFT